MRYTFVASEEMTETLIALKVFTGSKDQGEVLEKAISLLRYGMEAQQRGGCLAVVKDRSEPGRRDIDLTGDWTAR